MIAYDEWRGDHMKALMTPREVADMLRVQVLTLAAWRNRGHGPAYTRIGSGDRSPVRYSRDDVEAWLVSRTSDRHSDAQCDVTVTRNVTHGVTHGVTSRGDEGGQE